MRTLESASLQYPRPTEDTGSVQSTVRRMLDQIRGMLNRLGLCGPGSGGDFHLLLVTEVTRMSGGFFCVAAWDVHEEKILRPLTESGGYWSFPEKEAPWRPGYLLEVSARKEIPGNLPHRRENLVVCRRPRVLEQWDEPELYEAVLEKAGSSIQSYFGTSLIENKYIPEGTDCPSLGSVQTRRDRITFVDDGWGKLRLRFRDGDDQVYTLPVTCDSLQRRFSPKDGAFGIAEANEWLQSDAPDTELILRLGFSRGFTGKDGRWDPPRCYLQLNGLIGRTGSARIGEDSRSMLAGEPLS